ncbi:MAG TPA: hypothetical protein VH763_10725 [Gemmatimonadales bacterium]
METLEALKSRVRGACAQLGVVLLTLGCGHTDPFTDPSQVSDQPFDPSPPVRLTLNAGSDAEAAWLPDGSGILYSAAQSSRPDADVCLALLPPSGGSQRQLTCDVPGGPDLRDGIQSAAPSSDGRLAFLGTSSTLNGEIPFLQVILLSPSLNPVGAAQIRTFPYTASDGQVHRTASQLRWLGPSLLVYLAETFDARRACRLCPLDTIVTGLAVATLDPGSPGRAPTVVPETQFASGVSPGDTPDLIYFTLGGDTRVFQRTLSSGSVQLIYDFGAAGIARDVHVQGSRMVATVGGRVAFSNDPELGPTQWDSGGVVHLVDLAGGTDTPLPGPGLFRRPVLAPTSDRVVAEGYPLIITPRLDSITGITVKDTTVGRNSDLYLFTLP